MSLTEQVFVEIFDSTKPVKKNGTTYDVVDNAQLSLVVDGVVTNTTRAVPRTPRECFEFCKMFGWKCEIVEGKMVIYTNIKELEKI